METAQTLKNLRDVRDIVSSHEHFDICTWLQVHDSFGYPLLTIDTQESDIGHTCGTVMCIGGTAAVLMAIRLYGSAARATSITAAEVTAWLGLTGVQAYELFYADEYGSHGDLDWMPLVTRADAVQAIDNVLQHGEPRWREVLGRKIEGAMGDEAEEN